MISALMISLMILSDVGDMAPHSRQCRRCRFWVDPSVHGLTRLRIVWFTTSYAGVTKGLFPRQHNMWGEKLTGPLHVVAWVYWKHLHRLRSRNSMQGS